MLFRRSILTSAASLCLLGGAFATVQAFAADERENDHDGVMVYTMSNAAAANQIVAYRENRNGVLDMVATVATGGLGTGAGLGSQGSVVLSQGNRWLIAVNAGSNDVSVLPRLGRTAFFGLENPVGRNLAD